MEEGTPRGPKFKPIHAVIIAAVAAVAIGAAYYFTIGSAYAAVVAAGDNVSVYYTGTFINGTMFGTNIGQSSLNFTVGAGQLIQGFDQGVIGMRVGQNKTITVPPSEGYGEVNQSLIVSLPISVFGNTTVYNGMMVTSSTGQHAIIIAVNTTNATVDFNPPLAGKTLIFHVQVIAIKK